MKTNRSTFVGGATKPAIEARLDADRLDLNISAFHRRSESCGVVVRAHVKGHRSVEVALRQLSAGASGIAVESVAEARRYEASGIGDILITRIGREPWLWAQMAELAARCRLSVYADSPAIVDGLGAAAESAGVQIGVLMRVNSGTHAFRAAFEDLCFLIDMISRQIGLWFDGICVHPDMSSHDAAVNRSTLGSTAARHAVLVAERLRSKGRPCRVIAVGGTATAEGALQVNGITEICSGAYALLDAGMIAAGVCDEVDIALKVRIRADSGVLQRDAAIRILVEHPYPWQTSLDCEIRLGEWAPAVHVIPLVKRLKTLSVHGAGFSAETWELSTPLDALTI